MSGKTAYVCGPLTELQSQERLSAMRFYERIAGVCLEGLGERAFVPHEHFDPVRDASFTPRQVDEAERYQICHRANLLIVVAGFGPSWGGGIEVEMANHSKVPVLVLFPKNKKVSRLLMGNPAVIANLPYENENHALSLLRATFLSLAVQTA